MHGVKLLILAGLQPFRPSMQCSL